MRPRTFRAATLVILLGSAVVPLSQLAFAQDAALDTRQKARQLGEEGLQHFDAGRWETALRKLEEADATLPATTLRLYAARSLVKLGRLVEAERRYASTEEVALPADASPVLIQARIDSASERAALLAEIPTLTIEVEGGAELRSVRIDGQTSSSSDASMSYRLDPGPHQVEVTGADGTVSTRQVVLTRRQPLREMFALNVGAVTAPPRGRDATDDGTDGSTQRTLGFISLGAGGAGLALFGVAGGLAMGEASAKGCDGGSCPVPDAELDGARGLRTASMIGFYTGVGFAALGAVLVFTAPSQEPHRTAVRAAIRPGGIFAEGSF